MVAPRAMEIISPMIAPNGTGDGGGAIGGANDLGRRRTPDDVAPTSAWGSLLQDTSMHPVLESTDQKVGGSSPSERAE